MAQIRKKSTKKKLTARQKEQQAKAKQRSKEYKKQVNRIKRFMKSAEKRGYVFNESAKNLLKEPKRITSATIKKLEKVKPELLYKKSYKEIEGKRLRGDKARKEDRRQAAKKAQETRKQNQKLKPFLKPAQDILKTQDFSIEHFNNIPFFPNPYHNGEEKSATFLAVSNNRLDRDLKIIEEMSFAVPIYKELYQKLLDMIESKSKSFTAQWYYKLHLPDPKQEDYYRGMVYLVLDQLDKFLSVDTITDKLIAQTLQAISENDITGYEDELLQPEDYQLNSTTNLVNYYDQYIEDEDEQDLYNL